MGTGSGNIAIFLKQSFPCAKVQGVDISSKALKVACKNGRAHAPAIEFIQSALFTTIAENTSYDIIVANLPYVPQDVQVTREVSREPQEAIFAGNDGLDVLRAFEAQRRDKGIMFGELWLEFFPSQEKEIEKIFNTHRVDFLSDVGGVVRFAKIV